MPASKLLAAPAAATVPSADRCSSVGRGSAPVNLALDPSSAAPVGATASKNTTAAITVTLTVTP